MNGKIKKYILTALAAAALAASSIAVLACGDDGGDKKADGKKSELFGGFELSESRDVEFTNDESLGGDTNANGESYLFTSDVYPLDTIVGSSIGGIKYNVYQKLRLRRDHSYEYDLEITVRMVGETNINLVKLEAETSGVFTYTVNADDPNRFTVEVSDPTAGSERRYGAYITGENNIYSWKMSSSPNYTLDVARAVAEKTDGDVLDRYIRGRTVEVIKSGADRVLECNAFYFDFMNDLAPYCSYDSSSVPKEDEPIVPPDPPVPTQNVAPTAVDIGERADCVISLGMGAPLSIVLTYPDKSIKNATLDGAVAAGKVVGENSVFEFDAGYADLSQSLSASVGDKRFDFIPVELIKSSLGAAKNGLRGRAQDGLLANVLAVAQVCGVSVDADIEEYVYPASQSVYQGAQWGKRDNMDVEDTDKKTEDFAWERVPVLSIENGVPTLEYRFELDPDSHGKISAKLAVAGEKSDVSVERVSSADGDGAQTYSLKAVVSSPSEFAVDVSVSVCDGENIMSTATYSVNRALAKAYLLESDNALKKQADALWSLAKSAAWFINCDDIRYVYNFDANNCNYAFACGEYSYAVAASAPDYGEGVWGTRIYVGGKLVHDNSGEVKGDNDSFIASRGAAIDGKYPFAITLDGARIDGISAADDGNGRAAIEINVVSDSVLDTTLFYNNTSGAINADCDVTIGGTKGATLTVLGNIYTSGKLTIDGVNVKATVKGDVDGVTCGELDVKNGGGLWVEYASKAASSNSGVGVSGNLTVDGDLRIKGFDRGVYLCDDTAEQTFTVNGGNVDIAAARIGIDCKDVFDDPNADAKHYLPRELYFNGGVTRINVTDGQNGVGGVMICNVTVGDGELYIDVAHGDGIAGKSNGWWNEWAGVWQSQSSLPAVIRTTSASEKRGALSVKVRGGGIVATVKQMSLDGGNVYLYGETQASGFIRSVNGMTITARNCDLTMENGAGVEKSGRAIQVEEGDEVITVTNSAKVAFKNCDAPIACWGAKAGATAKLHNDGLVILDTYKVGLAQWELDSWELKLQVINNGEVRVTNQR